MVDWIMHHTHNLFRKWLYGYTLEWILYIYYNLTLQNYQIQFLFSKVFLIQCISLLLHFTLSSKEKSLHAFDTLLSNFLS